MSWVSNRWAVQAEVQRLPVVGPRRLASEYRLQTSDATRGALRAPNFDLSNFTIASPEMAELDALDEDKAFAFGEAGNPVDPSKAP